MDEETVETIECGYCGTDTPEDDTVHTETHDSVCQSCLENSFAYVANAGHYHNDNVVQDYRGYNICENDAVTLYSGDLIHCDDATRCDSCRDWYPSDDVNEYGYCESCQIAMDTDERHDMHHISSYCYQPTAKFHGKATSGIYFGTEVEMSAPSLTFREIDESAEWLQDEMQGLVYCKADGSISDGFEMVTHPMSMDYIHEHIERFERVFKELVDRGFRSHKTKSCGMHVHVSKGPLSPLQLYRVGKLFLEHKAFVLKISRRTEDRFDNWAPLDESRVTLAAKCKKKDGGRRGALNLNPSSTAEFRIWRGTLNPATFLASLELTGALLDWAKDVPNHSINPHSFADFTHKNQKQYAQASAYLESKGF